MGTLMGHVVPGTCFSVLAIWWTFAVHRNYYKAKSNGTKFRSWTCFQLERFPNVPLESIVKLLLIGIGISGETVTGFNDKGVFVQMVNGQHITMYVFFGIQATVELLQFYNFQAIPPNCEYVASLLAFAMESLLFYFHLHGRSQLDILIHILLIITIWGCCVSVAMEMFLREQVMVPLMRAYFTLLQGTWFYHVGFILYPPSNTTSKWDESSHSHLMLATMYFAWHCAGAFIFIIFVGGIVYLRYRRRLKNNVSTFQANGKIENNEFALLKHCDSDSEGL